MVKREYGQGTMRVACLGNAFGSPTWWCHDNNASRIFVIDRRDKYRPLIPGIDTPSEERGE